MAKNHGTILSRKAKVKLALEAQATRINKKEIFRKAKKQNPQSNSG